ncbi:MAG TPA: hypothetical protein VF992_06725 [Thermoplasmata archaeon]
MVSTDGQPEMLLSYDVPATARSAAVKVCHLIFGRSDSPYDRPVPYLHRRGVVWVGQSVFLLPLDEAVSMARDLEALGARVRMARVRIEAGEVGRLRKR